MTPWLLIEVVAIVAVWLSAGWLAWPYLARRYNAVQVRLIAFVGAVALIWIVGGIVMSSVPIEVDMTILIVSLAAGLVLRLVRLRRDGGGELGLQVTRTMIIFQAVVLVMGLLFLPLLLSQGSGS